MNKLVNYNPLGVNKFFDDFFNRDLTDFFGTDGNFSQPSVNVVETEKAFRIEVAAPGLGKDDFNLEIDRNRLVISAKKEASNEVEEEKFMRREFNYTAFTRSFQLPEGVNVDEIGATYDKGVLHVALPKREEAHTDPVKRIEVS